MSENEIPMDVDRLMQALDRLPIGQREVLRLRHEARLSLAAIAQQRQETPESAAASLLAAAQSLHAQSAGIAPK